MLADGQRGLVESPSCKRGRGDTARPQSEARTTAQGQQGRCHWLPSHGGGWGSLHTCAPGSVLGSPVLATLSTQSQGRLGRVAFHAWGPPQGAWGLHSALMLVDCQAVFLDSPDLPPGQCHGRPGAADPQQLLTPTSVPSCCVSSRRAVGSKRSGNRRPQGPPAPQDTALPGGSLESSRAHPPGLWAASGGNPGSSSHPLGE